MNINLEYYKQKLEKLQKKIIEENKIEKQSLETVELDQSRMGRLSRMDAMQSQQMAIEAKRRRDINLQRIHAALKRIENDEFGYCVNCDEYIKPKRLDFDPTTVLCIDCASGKKD